MIKSIEQLNKETLNKPATLEDIKQRIVDTFNSSHNNCDEDDAEEIVEPSDDEVQVKKPYNPKKDKEVADEQYRIIKESIDNSIKNLQDKDGKINIKELDNIVRIMAHTHIKVLTAGIYPYVTTDLKTKQYFDGYKQGLHTMEKSFTDSVNGNLRKVESAILVEIDRLNMVQNDLIKLREFVLNKFTKLTSIKNIFDQKFDDLNEKARKICELV